jgi:predicted RNA-binding protein (virulence factor B family)
MKQILLIATMLLTFGVSQAQTEYYTRQEALEALKQNGFQLEHVDESLKKDREFVLEAVKNNGYALEYADESLKNDREVVLEAVKNHGNALHYADESFRKDREVVLEAVKSNWEALYYADESLRKDRHEIVWSVPIMPVGDCQKLADYLQARGEKLVSPYEYKPDVMFVADPRVYFNPFKVPVINLGHGIGSKGLYYGAH